MNRAKYAIMYVCMYAVGKSKGLYSYDIVRLYKAEHVTSSFSQHIPNSLGSYNTFQLHRIPFREDRPDPPFSILDDLSWVCSQEPNDFFPERWVLRYPVHDDPLDTSDLEASEMVNSLRVEENGVTTCHEM